MLVWPTKRYEINATYEFYGELIAIAGDRSGCYAIIKADERENKNVIITSTP